MEALKIPQLSRPHFLLFQKPQMIKMHYETIKVHSGSKCYLNVVSEES
jgi:hypothetical protein